MHPFHSHQFDLNIYLTVYFVLKIVTNIKLFMCLHFCITILIKVKSQLKIVNNMKLIYVSLLLHYYSHQS